SKDRVEAPVRKQVALLALTVGVACAVASAGGQGLSPGQTRATRATAIVGASVVNVDGGPAVQDAVVVIEGDRITAIGPAATTPVPQGAEVIRATGKWIS